MLGVLHEKLPLSGRGRRIAFLALTGAAALAVVLFVDLSPRVDRDFFFSSDDPQLQQDRRILELFPLRPQAIVSAAGDIYSLDYARRVGRLSRDLSEVDGVLRIRDIHHFPSTRRLGPSVVLGVAAAICLVLIVFPRLAELSTRIAADGREEG